MKNSDICYVKVMKYMIADLYDKFLINEPGYYPVIQKYYYNEWEKFEMQQHLHNRIEIMYVIKGDCTVRCREEKVHMFAGDFILLNAGTAHALSVDNPRGCMVLNIEFVFEKQRSPAPDFLTLYRNSTDLQKILSQQAEYYRIKDDGEVYRILFSALENSDAEKSNHFSLDLWMALLLLSCARLATLNLSQGSDDYIQSAKDYIAKNYFRDIRVADISEYIHIHPAYLQRLFKKRCGMSVIDYITQYRMEKAYYLLSRTNMSIVDIANSVGINSQQYFTRLFKKTMDITPKALRDSKASDTPVIDLPDRDINWTWRPTLPLTETACDTDMEWINYLSTGGKVPGTLNGYSKDSHDGEAAAPGYKRNIRE